MERKADFIAAHGRDDWQFMAQDRGDWWTLQTQCGPVPRAYAINKATGELFELPDDRCPFVVITPARVTARGGD